LKSKRSYYVICIDLIDYLPKTSVATSKKNLKFFNKRDSILIDIAKQLKSSLPFMAKIARYDGNKFAIGIYGSMKVVRHSLAMIESILTPVFSDYILSIAIYPKEAKKITDLIKLAHKRLDLKYESVVQKKELHRLRLEKLSTLGQLAAGLAHEIRNPLTSIRGFVQIAALESGVVKKWESVILPEIDRVNDLLGQFLSLSELKPVTFKLFCLDDLIKDVLSLLKLKSFMLGHDIIIKQPEVPVKIEADPEQLKQVLINLIQNSLESFEEKGTITISWEIVSDDVLIFIEDSGKGIDPDVLPKIFDPFFTTKEEGTGMGLAICQRIIQEHNGTIQVITIPKRGTTFLIKLPVKNYSLQILNAKDDDNLLKSSDLSFSFS